MTTPTEDGWSRDLTEAEGNDIVSGIQAVLFLDADERGEFWSGSKVWDQSTIEQVAAVLDAADLRPPANERSL